MILDMVLTIFFCLRRNYITNFIQKISLIRFIFIGEDMLFYSFLYNIKYSYFDYDGPSLDKLLPNNYIEYAEGHFNDSNGANILKHVSVCMILTIIIFVMEF